MSRKPVPPLHLVPRQPEPGSFRVYDGPVSSDIVAIRAWRDKFRGPRIVRSNKAPPPRTAPPSDSIYGLASRNPEPPRPDEPQFRASGRDLLWIALVVWLGLMLLGH